MECRQMPNFKGNEYLCKLGKEYLNATLCKFVLYSLQHSETLDVGLSHVFLAITIGELSTLKQVRFFGPPSCRCGLNLRRLLCLRQHI